MCAIETADELFKTIARGRLSTAMAAFSIDEGGALTTPQIDDLVMLIKYGSWREVQAYVEAHGLTPTDLPPIEQQFDVAALSYPLEIVSQGRDVFGRTVFRAITPAATGCAAHDIGKDLINNEFIQTSTDEELFEFIKKGRLATDPANVTGNEMPAQRGQSEPDRRGNFERRRLSARTEQRDRRSPDDPRSRLEPARHV